VVYPGLTIPKFRELHNELTSLQYANFYSWKLKSKRVIQLFL